MIHVIKKTTEAGVTTSRNMAITKATWQRILDKKLKDDTVSWELQRESVTPEAVVLTAGTKDEVVKVTTKNAIGNPDTDEAEKLRRLEKGRVTRFNNRVESLAGMDSKSREKALKKYKGDDKEAVIAELATRPLNN